MSLKIDYDNSWIQNLRLRNYATGSLPSAGSATKGAIYLDSTLNTLVYDNGTSLLTLSTGGSGITGTLTSPQIVVASGTSTVNGDATFTFNTTTHLFTLGDAGTTKARFIHNAATLGTGEAGIDFTAKVSNTSGTQNAIRYNFTSNGTSPTLFLGEYATLASYAGSGAAAAHYLEVTTTGTGTSLNLGSNSFSGGGNVGVVADIGGTTAGNNIGVQAHVRSGTGNNIAIFGDAFASDVAATNVGVWGNAHPSNGAALKLGGFFGLFTSTPNLADAALMCDNGNASTTTDIFVARSNGSNVFKLRKDGRLDHTPTSVPASSNGMTLTYGTLGSQATAITLTATLASNVTDQLAISKTITTPSDATSGAQTAESITINGSYTGSHKTYGLQIENSVAGTNNNYALSASCDGGGGSGAYNIGIYAQGGGTPGSTGFGLFGGATASKNNCGVQGQANFNTGFQAIGGYFSLGSVGFVVPPVTAVIVAENNSTGKPLLIARDSGSSRYTLNANGTTSISSSTLSGDVAGYQASYDFANSASASMWGHNVSVNTSSGTGPLQLFAGRFAVNSGYTGTHVNLGVYGYSGCSSTGTALNLTDTTPPEVSCGIFGASDNSGTGTAAGVVGKSGQGAGTGKRYGVIGAAVGSGASETSVGILGLAHPSAGTKIGGYFGLNTTEPSYISAALIADNGSASSTSIFVGRSAGTTTVFEITSAGNTDFHTNQALRFVLEQGTTDPVTDLTTGRLFFNTNTNDVKVYYSATWHAISGGGGGGITGSLYSSGGRIVVETGTSTVADYAQLNWDDSFKTFKLGDFGTTKTLMDHQAGTITTSAPAYNLAATFSTGQSTTQTGSTITINGAGSASFDEIAHTIWLKGSGGSNYTGSALACTLDIQHDVASTGTSLSTGQGNLGVRVTVSGTTNGDAGGIYAKANGSGNASRFGVKGVGSGSYASGIYPGVIGASEAFSGTAVGGLFYTGFSQPTLVGSAGLIADGAGSNPSFIAQDSGTERFSIQSDGSTRSASNVGHELRNAHAKIARYVYPLEDTSTSNNTAQEIHIDSATSTQLPDLVDGDTFSYTVHLTARDTSGTNHVNKSAYYVFSFLASRASGTTNIIGSVTNLVTIEETGVTAWDVGATASPLGFAAARAVPTFTGETGETIKLRGWVEITKLNSSN